MPKVNFKTLQVFPIFKIFYKKNLVANLKNTWSSSVANFMGDLFLSVLTPPRLSLSYIDYSNKANQVRIICSNLKIFSPFVHELFFWEIFNHDDLFSLFWTRKEKMLKEVSPPIFRNSSPVILPLPPIFPTPSLLYSMSSLDVPLNWILGKV